MTESTSEYKKRIEEIKQSIENEPYMAKMREDIAEGISKTGIRQATVEEQFQSVLDETTSKDVISAPEIILARDGAQTLGERLNEDKVTIDEQLTKNSKRTSGFVNVTEFGAVGDGVTDDTLAIQSASDYATENKLKLVSDGGEYLISDTITLLCSHDLSLASFICDGTQVSPVIRVGYVDGDSRLVAINSKLPSVANAVMGVKTRDWHNTGIGVELSNAIQSQYNVKGISGFKTGLRCVGYDEGFAYNSVTVQSIVDCQVTLELDQENSGWVNENTFYNGRFSPRSRFGGDILEDWVGTRSILIKQGNNNLFIKPCVESMNVEYSIEIIVGSYNTFVNGRYEYDGAKRILFNSSYADSCNSNLFIGGYQSYNLKFTYTGNFNSNYNSVIPGRGLNKIDSLATTKDGLKVFNTTELLENSYDSPSWISRIDREGVAVKTYDQEVPSAQLTPDGYLRLGTNAYARYYNGFRIGGANLHNAVDNVAPLGAPSNRWSQVYAGTGAINTSDEREKSDIETIPDRWLDAWGDIEWVMYRFKNAIDEKGNENARYHTGLIAQRVKEAFEKHELDPFELGILCYDEWQDEEEKTTRNRYGIRYEEALSLESAYQRREIERLKSLISFGV